MVIIKKGKTLMDLAFHQKKQKMNLKPTFKNFI